MGMKQSKFGLGPIRGQSFLFVSIFPYQYLLFTTDELSYIGRIDIIQGGKKREGN